MSVQQEEVVIRMGMDLSKLEKGMRESDRIFQQYSRKAGSPMYQGSPDTSIPQSWSTLGNLSKKSQEALGGGVGGAGLLGILTQLRNMNPAVDGLITRFGALATRLSGMGLIAAPFVGAFSLIKNSMREAWELAERAEAIQTSSKFMIDLERAAYAAGEGVESATGKLYRLQTVIGAAQDGSKEALESLKAIGVSPWGKSMEQVYLEVAAALSKIDDPAKKAAVATGLLGKNSQSAVETLEKLNEQVKRGRFSPLEQRDLDVLATAQQKLRDFYADYTSHWKDLGKVITASWIRGLGLVKDSDIKEKFEPTIQKPGKTPEEIAKEQDEIKKARAEYNAALEKTFNKATQELNLRFKAKDLEKEIAAMAGESAKKLEKMTELENTRTEVKKLQKEQQAEYLRAQEKQNALEKQYGDLLRNRENMLNSAAHAYNDRSRWSLGDMIGADPDKMLGAVSRYMGRNLNPMEANKLWRGMQERMRLANFAQNSEEAAKAFSLAGMGDMAAMATDDAMSWRKRIDSLSSSERDPMKDSVKQLNSIDQSITELLAKAKNEGININPRMGP